MPNRAKDEKRREQWLESQRKRLERQAAHKPKEPERRRPIAVRGREIPSS
jgi:hypothetical protein